MVSGWPKSSIDVAWPLIHFHRSLSLSSDVLSLSSSIDLPAVRQPDRGAGGQVARHACWPSLQPEWHGLSLSVQTPDWQLSAPLQNRPSGQAVPSGTKPLTGQLWPAVPLQVSATSHAPAAARQTVPDDATTLAGQVAPGVPVHVSLTSHMSPEPARQTMPALPGASLAGQVAPGVPLHVSLTSHMSPEPARQTAPALPGASLAGQVAPGVPVHVSLTSHMSPEPARQTVPALPGASLAGQVAPGV